MTESTEIHYLSAMGHRWLRAPHWKKAAILAGFGCDYFEERRGLPGHEFYVLRDADDELRAVIEVVANKVVAIRGPYGDAIKREPYLRLCYRFLVSRMFHVIYLDRCRLSASTVLSGYRDRPGYRERKKRDGYLDVAAGVLTFDAPSGQGTYLPVSVVQEACPAVHEGPAHPYDVNCTMFTPEVTYRVASDGLAMTYGRSVRGDHWFDMAWPLRRVKSAFQTRVHDCAAPYLVDAFWSALVGQGVELPSKAWAIGCVLDSSLTPPAVDKELRAHLFNSMDRVEMGGWSLVTGPERWVCEVVRSRCDPRKETNAFLVPAGVPTWEAVQRGRLVSFTLDPDTLVLNSTRAVPESVMRVLQSLAVGREVDSRATSTPLAREAFLRQVRGRPAPPLSWADQPGPALSLLRSLHVSTPEATAFMERLLNADDGRAAALLRQAFPGLALGAQADGAERSRHGRAAAQALCLLMLPDKALALRLLAADRDLQKGFTALVSARFDSPKSPEQRRLAWASSASEVAALVPRLLPLTAQQALQFGPATHNLYRALS